MCKTALSFVFWDLQTRNIIAQLQMILFLTIEEMMDMNRSRRLNFNAPFLSTKRHDVNQEKVPGQCPEASVPFCWETTPGMPKNMSHLKHDPESETPRLKLPPGRLKVCYSLDYINFSCFIILINSISNGFRCTLMVKTTTLMVPVKA